MAEGAPAERAAASEQPAAAESHASAERAAALERAASAEQAVCARHLRRLWALPGTVLGRSGWPPTISQRLHWHWNYWWQAHLLDSLVDAQLRQPTDERARLIDRFIATVHRRNFGSWVNDYYDDIAWLGLALQRVRQLQLSTVDEPIEAISKRLHEGWTEDLGGGIWWRRGDSFKNTPANGPAAIFHARTGDQQRAGAMTQWLTDTLVDPETGLVWDGIRADTGEVVKHIFSYCQGVYLGACLEQSRWDDAARTIRAVEKHLAPQGILPGSEGGDGGLFSAIAARYLALAANKANKLPRPEAETAKRLVQNSAEACWNGAAQEKTGPLFSAYWGKPAPNPPGKAERDLSVQIGGWMLLEAAATL
ncbi:glycoside hydrolase [Amycolatopsis sp. A1MSW2902]